MPRPTSKPAWTQGNGSQATISIEPSAGQKLSGWAAAFKPPFQTLNWLFQMLSDWTDWFDSGCENFVSVTANYTVLTPSSSQVGITTIFADPTAGAITVTLPAAPVSGQKVRVKHTGIGSGNNVTVGRNGKNIESAASDVTLTQGDFIMLIYDGTAWWQFGGV